jgi:hypothetical protein
MATKILTAERLRELMDYDPETGKFCRKVTASSSGIAGAEPGWVASNGYRYIGIDGSQRLAHRLAFLWVSGEHPGKLVDHIDGNKLNNAISNLRVVDQATNNQNRRATKKNKWGLLGVSKSVVRAKPWKAEITVNGAARHLGVFSSPEAAHAAYLEAKRRLHPGCTI